MDSKIHYKRVHVDKKTVCPILDSSTKLFNRCYYLDGFIGVISKLRWKQFNSLLFFFFLLYPWKVGCHCLLLTLPNGDQGHHRDGEKSLCLWTFLSRFESQTWMPGIHIRTQSHEPGMLTFYTIWMAIPYIFKLNYKIFAEYEFKSYFW